MCMDIKAYIKYSAEWLASDRKHLYVSLFSKQNKAETKYRNNKIQMAN